MVKIAHIADVHIRNLKLHKEYRFVFKDLYKKLKKENVDIIYVAGDVAHTKTQLSPEYFDLCSEFFTNLANLAPTYIILGNHDGNLRTSSRQDALTPIVKALNNPNIYLLKDSQEVEIADGIVFNCLSIFDKSNWISPTDKNKINIALYHGSITGCKTDIGWVMKRGEEELSIFREFDFAMLGDIHKTNQMLEPSGRVRYAGSLIQQNHGETNDKGFLVWEITDKQCFKVSHIKLASLSPYITIRLTSKGLIPKNLKIPANAKLRLVSDTNLPLNKRRRAIEKAKSIFKPEFITFVRRPGAFEELSESAASTNRADLRDIAVQKDLMREYLDSYGLKKETLEKVFELNKKYNTLIEENEEVGRNVNWELKTLKWDNLFNYGEGNTINFQNLNGVIGIFGQNYSGKSSIVDTILYTLFNTTSKNERKNLNIINENKDYGMGQAEILVGSNLFTIRRRSEKYTKKLKGKVTAEAKTELEFTREDTITKKVYELNGLTRNKTDKLIRKKFGTLQDFLFTSMTSQMGALSFINEGLTKRKEILAKFLDLELFEKKFKLAKEDAAVLKANIRRLKERDFKAEQKEIQLKIDSSLKKIESRNKRCLTLEAKVSLLKEERQVLILAIKTLPNEIIDVGLVKHLLGSSSLEITSLKAKNEHLGEEVKLKKSLVEQIDDFLKNFEFDKVKEKQQSILEKTATLRTILNDIETVEQNIKRGEQKVKLLSQVPCGDQFLSCRFIKDAHQSKEGLSKIRNQLTSIQKKSQALQEDLEKLNPRKNEEYLKKYQQVLLKKSKLTQESYQAELKIGKNKALVVSLDHKIAACQKKLKKFDENKEAIENLEFLLETKNAIQNNISNVSQELEECNRAKMFLYKMHGSLEQEYKNLELEKQEHFRIHEEFAIYDLFLRCMHSNGISYDIIKRKLPIINSEISKILTNIVNFEIFFEEDEKQLNIFIKHTDQAPRPLSMGSGAEKTIAAIAIRLSLLSVSNLPKPNVFILDEPGTALDENNMEGFIRILDIIKVYFKTILLISHLENLKDCVDTEIFIDKKDGYAYVNRVN